MRANIGDFLELRSALAQTSAQIEKGSGRALGLSATQKGRGRFMRFVYLRLYL